MNKKLILLSDDLVDPLEKIVQSTLRAFPYSSPRLVSHSFIGEDELPELLDSIQGEDALVYYQFVHPSMHEFMKHYCEYAPCVDLFAFLSTPLEAHLQQGMASEPAASSLDSNYFARMEAIEFSVKYDDGKDPRGIPKADIVLIGISRTSKTPLSMYLAGMQYKCANIPLYPEVALPPELFEIDPAKIIGLTHDIEELMRIRRERLKQMGFVDNNRYADLQRIETEQRYAQQVFERLGCTVINVSGSAVEETAAQIIRTLRQTRTHDRETSRF